MGVCVSGLRTGYFCGSQSVSGIFLELVCIVSHGYGLMTGFSAMTGVDWGNLLLLGVLFW